MKAGLLEIADVFVVNKADREGAMRIKTELEMMLHLRPATEWTVPVLLTEATNGKGINELLAAVTSHREVQQRHGTGAELSAAARQGEFVAVLREEICRRVEASLENGRFGALLGQVTRGEIDPYQAALKLIDDDESMRTVLRRPPVA
jgi:LAO/AO transport system kinase